MLRRAVELGVDHIDTADFYRGPDGTARANDLIREALFPYPGGLVIATKVGPVVGPDGVAQGTAADIRPAVEANLKALGLDRLDLVYLRIGYRTGQSRQALCMTGSPTPLQTQALSRVPTWPSSGSCHTLSEGRVRR